MAVGRMVLLPTTGTPVAGAVQCALPAAEVDELRQRLGDRAAAVLAFLGGDVAPDGFDPVAAVRNDD
jgi:hypothetical protein